MSSLVRRLQIRAMQERGYVRTSYVLQLNAKKEVVKVPVRHGGLILDPDNQPVGYHWPRFLPKKVDA